jgi:hypothetical protein
MGASRVVDVWEDQGRTFEVVMASDVTRDGMGLELTDLTSPEGGPPFLKPSGTATVAGSTS